MKRPQRQLRPGLIAASVALGTAWAAATSASETGVKIGGVRFAEQIAAGAVRLELHGGGVLRHRGLLRAYAAALYLPRGESAERVLEDVPKRLEIEYFWPIDAADFGKAAESLLADRHSAETLAGLRDRLSALHERYENIEPGDRYALTYWPGIGTELSKNGRRLAVVTGSDFASAYFALWLGDDPIDSRLRDALRTEISNRARTE